MAKSKIKKQKAVNKDLSIENLDESRGQFHKNLILAKFSSVKGQARSKHQIKSALLTNRHIIIIGPPGIGKTTIAKNIAELLPNIIVNDCPYHCDPNIPFCPFCKTSKTKPKTKLVRGIDRFVRVQGSPDLTAEDLIGDIDPIKALKFGPLSLEAFTPGKIFKANNGVLFFDELNRCPEKIQNSLLQVLQEGVATVGSYTFELPANFIFVGTMNPEESAGTEKLSDVFLDRFDVVHMTYPERVDLETDIVVNKGMQLPVEFPNKLLQFMVLFVSSLRSNKDLRKKPSVRASIGLYERSQSNAILAKRTVVFPADIASAVISVLSHRIELKPSVKYLQTAEEFLTKEFRQFADDHAELGFERGDLV